MSQPQDGAGAATVERPAGALHVDFAGELFDVGVDDTLTIGRRGSIALDDNPYMHRDFLRVSHADGFWWVHNVGTRLPAQLTDPQGLMKSILAPGARLPLVFGVLLLTFTAGQTTYEIEISVPVPAYELQVTPVDVGETTMGAITFTPSQHLAILALAEPLLRLAGTGTAEVPTSVVAARRLGWTLTKFNRKIDNVCEKLERAGVTGLRGSSGVSATNRRLRLVEYALSALLVTAADLPKLEDEARANSVAGSAHPSRRTP